MKDSLHPQTHKKVMKVLLALAFFAIFCLVGTMDLQDTVSEARHYEEMVCSGHWPNYKNIEVNCDEY